MQTVDIAAFKRQTASKLLRCGWHCRKSGQDAREPEVEYAFRTRRTKRDQSGPEQESVVVIHPEFDNRLVLPDVWLPQPRMNRPLSVSSPKSGPDRIANVSARHIRSLPAREGRRKTAQNGGFLPGCARVSLRAAVRPERPSGRSGQFFSTPGSQINPDAGARFTLSRCSRRIMGLVETRAWTTQCAFHVFA